MANDSTSSTPKPGKPATKSMISGAGEPGGTDAGGGAAADAPAGTDDVATVGERAQEMRAGLAARRQAESLLAEASELRQRAAADADTMVTDAEALSAELVGEARDEAGRLVAAAQERADGILARARSEADQMREETDLERERLRAEIAESVRTDVEHAHAGLDAATPALENAVDVVASALAALEVLRSEDWTPRLALEQAEVSADPTAPLELVEVVPPQPRGDDSSLSVNPAEATDGEDVDDDARPLGWLFRSTQA